MTGRATFKQLTLPQVFVRCDLCGAVVDPSDTGRSAHSDHHDWVGGIEVAVRALLAAIERPELDLTREERSTVAAE